MTEKQVGGVTYREAGNEYFEKRGLRRYAGVWSLWALGVGAVISGDFFGWNFGLNAGGFGGLLYATIIIAIMYVGMCYSIAEMSPALPHTGGAYSFGRSAMGPWGGFITGLAENIEYVLTPAVIVVGIGGYLGAIFETPDSFAPVWWAISYLIFVGLNVWGVELTFRFSVFITFLALAILLVFWIGAAFHFDMDMALNIKPDEGHSAWLPRGWAGVTTALPFAIWFYLAIEQLPLAAEESHDPKRDMPRGLLYGILTLIICSVFTLFLNAGIAPGAQVVGTSNEPLFLAFKTIFGDGIGTKFLALIAVAGLIASFHTIIYAYGRNIYSLSRAGYFPQWLSITHGTRKTPHVALIVGAVIGFVMALIIQFGEKVFGGVPVGAVLLNMAVFGAVIAYLMQMMSFVILRKKLPDIERPYVSPLGTGGAWVAAIIAFVTLIFLFLNPDYVIGVYGCALWFLAGLLYFALVGRHKLVLSPEEEFALTGGGHGHPDTEGYGHTHVDETE
ncbi:MAG: ethanolamine permease [Proteobacteria bacterium]|nr:ethanolamine permease [Pseudomonadota bacterium]